MPKALPVRSFVLVSATLLSLGGMLDRIPALAQQPYLGTCDPDMGRGEYYKYECQRGDGSIGWSQGTRIGGGRPIISIHGRNTPNAYMLTKITNVYPGYFCYYEEGMHSTPSEKCKSRVQEEVNKPPAKVSANCNTQVVTEHDLLPQQQSNKFPTGWMPGGSDSVISEYFRILCPVKFAASGVKPPYKQIPYVPPAQAATPKPARSQVDPNHPDLGPVFKTIGLNRQMQQVNKNHQAILPTMKGGRNLLGHAMVQMKVLSYEPGTDRGYQFWLSVNCYTQEWKFLENDARLMGGALEGFGVIRANQMGPWACKRFGYSY
jgi:hypothetical protein